MMTARESATRLADLLSRERSAMAEFLVALSDFDRRKLWEQLGYAGLFPFLHRELGMSKAAAFYRKTAAELIQRFPEIVEPLKDGRLCITAVPEVAKVITPENWAEVLPRFFHRSRQEAKQVSAEISPVEAPPMREVVTAVRAAPERTVHPVNSLSVNNAPSAPPAPEAAPAPEQPPRRDTVEPLSAELSRFHVTVSRRFLAKLEKARDALSHSHPGASAEAILEAGLDLLLSRDAKRKGIVARPRSAPLPHPGPLPRPRGGEGSGSGEIPASVNRGGEGKRSRWIPASVKRVVWIRDQGRCQYPLESGGICGSTHRPEFDHVVPWACGGPSTVENVRVVCAVHNGFAARLVFGDDWMDRCTHGGAGTVQPEGPPPP